MTLMTDDEKREWLGRYIARIFKAAGWENLKIASNRISEHCKQDPLSDGALRGYVTGRTKPRSIVHEDALRAALKELGVDLYGYVPESHFGQLPPESSGEPEPESGPAPDWARLVDAVEGLTAAVNRLAQPPRLMTPFPPDAHDVFGSTLQPPSTNE